MNSIMSTFGLPTSNPASALLQRALHIIESQAYEDQMRYYRFRDLTNKDYTRVVSRAESISAPRNLGKRILQFLYF